MQKNLDNKVGMSMPIYMTLLSLYCIGEVDGCTRVCWMNGLEGFEKCWGVITD